MKFFPIVFILAVVCLAVAAGVSCLTFLVLVSISYLLRSFRCPKQEARDGICNSQKTPTKLIARRTWPGQFATTTTTAKPTTVKSSTTPPTNATTSITMAATTPLPILFNCSVHNPGNIIWLPYKIYFETTEWIEISLSFNSHESAPLYQSIAGAKRAELCVPIWRQREVLSNLPTSPATTGITIWIAKSLLPHQQNGWSNWNSQPSIWRLAKPMSM
jgi:hypothetical protein